MISLLNLCYVRVGTRDLDSSVRFATEILGLELVGREPGAAYVRGDDRDHSICYVQAEPGDHVTGFQLPDRAALERAAADLDARGISVRRGRRDEADHRRVGDFITLKDPTGNVIDLVVNPAHSGRRFFPSRDVRITEFGHIGLCTTDAVRDEAFWTGALGARVSDWIGEAALLRIDPVHHKVALFPARRAGLQHVNFQVATVDEIMRAYYFLTERGVRIVFGPGRHPTSTAVFLYFEGPDGLVYEYSSGVRLIEDEATYVPRRFPKAPSSFCMWGAKPDIAEFRDEAAAA